MLCFDHQRVGKYERMVTEDNLVGRGASLPWCTASTRPRQDDSHNRNIWDSLRASSDRALAADIVRRWASDSRRSPAYHRYQMMTRPSATAAAARRLRRRWPGEVLRSAPASALHSLSNTIRTLTMARRWSLLSGNINKRLNLIITFKWQHLQCTAIARCIT